jgi:hypothetical protein
MVNRETMHRLRRLALSLFVWLTAAMTLVAGTPHFNCRCPNGQVKLFCFGLTSKTTACCCNGGCCAKEEEDGKTCCSSQTDVAPSCCCCSNRHARRATAELESKGISTGAARTGCCTKTLAAQEPRSVTSPEKKPAKAAVFGLHVASVVTPARGLFGTFQLPPHEHQRPPPTNLVISLQHFLI